MTIYMPIKGKIVKEDDKKKAKKGNIMVICAHSDDDILGAGGAIAKYSREGYNVHTIILSYGELSHFHMKKEHVMEMRVKESLDAEHIVGGTSLIFFDHTDGQLSKEIPKKKTKFEIKNLMLKYKPKKIFTHSEDDMHPDHRATHKLVIESFDELNKDNKLKSEIYTFEISQLWNLKKRKQPKLVLDISNYFKFKIKALHTFKSQINLFSHTYEVNLLYLGVYVRAFLAGIRYKKKLAEVYFKVR